MQTRSLLLIFFFFLSGILNGQPAQKTLVIDTGKPLFDVPEHLWGLFFEDINLAGDGGLYAEMVKNRSFEFYKPLMGWKTVEERGKGSVQIENRTGEENPRFIRILREQSEGTFGIGNEGFRGMFVKAGNTYRFSVLACKESGQNPRLNITLLSSGGKVIGSALLSGFTGEWQKYTTTLTVNATDEEAVLQVMMTGQGILDLDMISLFPVDTWKGRENGLRADLVQMLADLKPGFLRFPGGCIVEGHELATRYQWKKTIGPVENRHQIVNRWNTEFAHRSTPDYYQSFGLGFYEYFLLCEDIGAEPLPILNCGMACQFNTAELVPLDELEPYIDDMLDLIEFANGPATSEWGKVRAGMGHPEPFNLKYLGVGNEQWGRQYGERFRIFAERIKKVYPEMHLIGGAGPSPDGEEFELLWQEMRTQKTDLVDEHYYRPPQWFLDNARRYDQYDRRGPKVFAGEYAAHSGFQTDQPESRNNWEAALAEAAFLTGIERNCDVVTLASYAPLFSHTDGWQWRPDLIWFDNHRCVATPNYYVQQLFSVNKGTHVLKSLCNGEVLAGQDSLYASAILDKETGEIIVKLVNAASVPGNITLSLLGKSIAKKQARLITLRCNDPAAYNALDQPGTVRPVETLVTFSGKKPLITFESRSVTVLRIPVK